MSTKMKVKKGDLVQIITGKDRGKRGRVIEARPSERRVLVENLNVAKRHTQTAAYPRQLAHGRRADPARRDHGQASARARLERDGRLPGLREPDARRDRGEGDQGRMSGSASASARDAGRSSTDEHRDIRAEAPPRKRTSRASRSDTSARSVRLQEELGLSSVMQVPRVTKITLNMGVGEAKTDAKALDAAVESSRPSPASTRRSAARRSPSRASSSARGCRWARA